MFSKIDCILSNTQGSVKLPKDASMVYKMCLYVFVMVYKIAHCG